jgi:predicted hydrocarbon binding protein/KaiC/GvpD/RAD55 family RecA-like ATPase
MRERAPSLAEIQEVPKKSLILLSGPPGAGKSTFCHQVVLNSLAMEKPVIFITTEQGPAEIVGRLREKGMGEPPPSALSFVDAFGGAVGLATPDMPGTTGANCQDLNSISMAITRLQQRTGRKDVLLAFDSLTSPYLFNREEVLRFMRLSLGRFAAEGNSVVALMDEGCGKQEDLGAMMSISDGVIQMETREDKHFLNVVKHPKLKPTRIEAPIKPERIRPEEFVFNPEVLAAYIRGDEAVMRREVGDFVYLFWPNFAHWSGMLWDPKRFPMMVYEMNKEDVPSTLKIMRENKAVKRALFPWPKSLLLRFMPKSFSKVKDMKKLLNGMDRGGLPGGPEQERVGIVEYLEEASKTDEHHVRIYECSECWGFDSIGATMGFYGPPFVAGMIRGLESWRGLERDWNCVETKCIGLGDPYCEVKLVPGEIDGLKDSIEKDISVIERIHERLMHHLMDFLLYGKPLLERPTLGSMVGMERVMHALVLPALAGERYRMALGMGGARSGKQVGERLLEAGLSDDEAVKRVLDFLNQCKVGKVTVDETIRIVENCESSQIKLFFTTREKVPSCYFTTGFLNGLFSAVKNQHVREIKCIAAGDPYCEWEIK